jgi:hypothetical protein
MADETPPPQSTQSDLPANPPVESREETVARVIEETDDVQGVEAHEELVDPTSRRGVNRAVARNAVLFAAIGAVVGAVLALVLSVLPGPVETDTVAGTIGYMAVLAVLVAIIFGLIGTLILLAREDGRIERKVEQKTGRPPEGPADPIDPKYDVDGR